MTSIKNKIEMSLVAEIGKKIIDQNLNSLTIEFDNDQFLFLKNNVGVIRFIQGELHEYSALQSLVRKGKAGEELGAETKDFQTLEKELMEQVSETEEVETTQLIYNSFFRPISELKSTFSDAELYFKPFEAPGGDFYWMKEYAKKTLVVVGDCTGHGIQGALISMSLVTLLKQHFILPPTSATDSLYEFYDLMTALIEDDNDGGFDAELGFILFEKETKKISCAGSGIDMIFKKPSGIEYYTSSKKALAKKKLKSYENKLMAGDQVFIFSDGITDQFDKDDRRVLGMRNLLKLVEEIPNDKSDLKGFLKSFNEFKGDTEPYDDQTMMILTA